MTVPRSRTPNTARRAKTMRAAVLYGPEDVRLEEIPVPSIGPGDVLVRVGAATTCGTDAKVFRRGHKHLLRQIGVQNACREAVWRQRKHALIGYVVDGRHVIDRGKHVALPVMDSHVCAGLADGAHRVFKTDACLPAALFQCLRERVITKGRQQFHISAK